MENASQALVIAGRVILAIIILSLMVFVFRNLSVFPTTDETNADIEQTRIFNTEYEVYDKKLMYGVDVISCLNKAKSHNEKYIDETLNLGGFVFGSKEEFYIQVEFWLKSALEESIEVYYVALEGNPPVAKERKYIEDPGAPDGADIPAFSPTPPYKSPFTLPNNNYISVIWGPHPMSAEQLRTKESIQTQITSKKYYLLDTDSGGRYTEFNNMVKVLLASSDELRQQVKNPNPDTKIGRSKVITDKLWSSAEWKTALYDLKQRKFECAFVDDYGKRMDGPGMEYKPETGRICKISFREL